MRETAPYKCDYCLQRKGETNHWWLRDMEAAQHNVFRMIPWNEQMADDRLAGIAGTVTAERDNKPKYEHICSESCASKALSKHMARMSQPPKPATVEEVVEGALAVRGAGVRDD